MNQKQTCKNKILEVLQRYGSKGLAGGVLETIVHEESIHKASTVARVARLMAESHIIQRGEFLVDGKRCVFYRVISN